MPAGSIRGHFKLRCRFHTQGAPPERLFALTRPACEMDFSVFCRGPGFRSGCDRMHSCRRSLRLSSRPAWKSSLSVVPFSVFKDYYEDLLKSPVYFFVTLINFFGNLAMFIPIGFFSALLFRNATLKRSAIIGFGMSTFIEFAQYFIMRNTAVDDIILNTLGAICGYWVYRLLRKMFPGFSREFICNITQAAGN